MFLSLYDRLLLIYKYKIYIICLKSFNMHNYIHLVKYTKIWNIKFCISKNETFMINNEIV